MMNQMKQTTRKANTYLPYGIVFTLIFEAVHIDLSGEDSRQLHHTDTYIAKSLIRMGYHLSNGQWRKKNFGQKADKSSSIDEEKTKEQHQNLEFITATTDTSVLEAEVPLQEEIHTQAPPMEMEQDIQEPPMDMPAPSVTETSTLEPTMSQTYIENQIRQLNESLTTSIGSMFEKLHQSVEHKF